MAEETNTADDDAAARPRPDKVQVVEGFTITVDPPLQPIKALRAGLRLLRNKEDTAQVFEITRALSGRSLTRTFRAFAQSAHGRRVLTQGIDLANEFGDFDRLRSMPEGSFGRAYLDFMESGNLETDGITAVARQTNAAFDFDAYPELTTYFRYATASHDVWHTLTGYERDALGELCVLAFTRAQIRNDSLQLIVLMGMMALKKENWRVPAIKAIRQAARTGRTARWLYGEDLLALLPRPLADVRDHLNIPYPETYRQIDRDLRFGLLKPMAKRPASSVAPSGA
ncbi:MAG: Coq4 family protein [Pseudomonadota bacterium]